MHKGARSTGGNISNSKMSDITKVLDEFMECVIAINKLKKLRRAVIRSLLPCNCLIILDSRNIFVIAQPQSGVPSSLYHEISGVTLTSPMALDIAKWDFGYEDPFLITIPKDILEKTSEERKIILEAIAKLHVESEYLRVIKITSLIQINPLFGPASYTMDDRLVFVLMPFTKELTEIYNTIIKPTVESYGLICRRADDFKTNKVIMQDIWKAICEAKFIIADLTELNPNVMYELGIAHTLGKETLLISQIGDKEPIKFPFDITHIRRIEYENSAIGGNKLMDSLKETVEYLLNPPSLS